MAVALLALSGALAFAGCGDDEETTTTTTTTAAETGATTTDATTTTTTGGEETTPGGAVVPAVPDCAEGEIYSEGSKSCVEQRSGDNPCPQGEVPAADQPSCLPKD